MRDDETANLIMEFIDTLPDTIREAVAMVPVLCLCPDEKFRERTPTEALHAIFADRQNGHLTAVAIAGALDYALGDPDVSTDRGAAEDLARREESRFLMEQALKGPMRDRHMHTARALWLEHRSGPLSIRSLRHSSMRPWVE